jgi:threonine/homoserine/homoserine lactone efflux protein
VLLMPVVPEPASLGLFVLAALAMLLTPGPAVLYIVTRSLDQGRRAGLVSVLGVHVGTLVHVGAAADLVYIGIRRLLDRRPPAAAAPGVSPRLRRAFLDGVIVNVLNPKTALFFVAFLPQFVTVARGHVGEQILMLGVVFVLLGTITDSLYAVSAGLAGRWLRGRSGFLAGERFISGGLYIGLGVAAAFSSQQRK